MHVWHAYKRGKQLYKEKKHKEALEYFSLIDTKELGNFDESIVHHFKALCFAHLGKLSKSMDSFQLALKYRPNYAKIYFDMGLTWYFFYDKSKVKEAVLKMMKKESKVEMAITCFEEALLLEPENSMFWYYRGYMLELMGKEQEAHESFEKCFLDSNPENSRLFGEKLSNTVQSV